MSASRRGVAGASSSSMPIFFGEPGPEAEIELIALLTQCLAVSALRPGFYVRLSDRNLWFYYLEALGLDEARIRDSVGGRRR